jgi:phosphatidylinositol-3,4,5-trisphosphate 3-phosphatase/dual-specificity protein phosphatase PTEN
LELKHQGYYRIYNLSNRTYDYKKFNGVVKSYKWVDHHAPNMETLFEICADMYEYLNKSKKRVIVVHCNAGKGRTGTSIACFMMYAGFMKNAEDAIRYYGRKRFTCGLGITQPSQIRYVKYFEKIYAGIINSPNSMVLKSVKVRTVPSMNGKSCKPYLEIERMSDNKIIFSGKGIVTKTYKQSLKV